MTAPDILRENMEQADDILRLLQPFSRQFPVDSPIGRSLRRASEDISNHHKMWSRNLNKILRNRDLTQHIPPLRYQHTNHTTGGPTMGSSKKYLPPIRRNLKHAAVAALKSKIADAIDSHRDALEPGEYAIRHRIVIDVAGVLRVSEDTPEGKNTRGIYSKAVVEYLLGRIADERLEAYPREDELRSEVIDDIVSELATDVANVVDGTLTDYDQSCLDSARELDFVNEIQQRLIESEKPRKGQCRFNGDVSIAVEKGGAS